MLHPHFKNKYIKSKIKGFEFTFLTTKLRWEGLTKNILKMLEKLKKLPIVEKTLPLVIVQVHLHFTIGLKKKKKKKNTEQEELF